MKIINWLIVIACVLGLIFVRVLEAKIFYDPFLDYFGTASKSAPFPSFDWGRLILSHLFRFGLNLLFSVVMIYFLFRRKDWAVQAAILIVLVFAITFPIYLYCISTEFEVGHLFSFYMRRFVIQPLIVLLIIPMFYYRKNISQAEN